MSVLLYRGDLLTSKNGLNADQSKDVSAYGLAIIDDLFAIAGDSRPPESVEELTQAFDGLGLEEDIEEKEEDKADEDEEVAERNGRAAKSVRNQSTETVMRLSR